jgi:hypothetical protein
MNKAWKRYIGNITAQAFGDAEVKDPQIDITQAGWYWADAEDNARYSDWKGPYSSREEALNAGKDYRTSEVEDWISLW